ncbi:acyltransferase [Lactobacillus delbrueckii]|uniref:Acyltransferase n=1 Tax=Lactobacillus delbrueckii subsp. bulgaricus TaxID=1585 RepID=A0AAV5PK81_LACDE|nr:acyltransferase [Lactobacillus delbrueckii]ADY85769.1 Probable membrane protein [Lactobacillus delbrueckii subsp. bulgaricus 2038]MCD5459329.1 acyltransferase [Lactobacillus delbrueckii subsp. bulgaricus]MCD9227225.1 acyltransferase [Lactobacillus delbrueckii subsp. bulgaricus]MCT3473760.1 acyltransferase [Lactobacillus delbrueckii subsp. bulgaricus]OAL41050.1 membrane protein [Lactobacillus delbrueckii subsp. bulgaricus]
MKKRYYFMDLMAIVSSFAVVMLHTSGSATGLKVVVNRFTPDGLWSIMPNILFAFAVPIFFMQSGAKVLNYRDRYDTKTFFTKRVSKVVVPFTFWSILGYILFKAVQGSNFLQSFLAESIIGPYWFFYSIIAFYLCVPVLSLLVQYVSDRLLLYLIGLVIFFKSVLPLAAVIFGQSMPFLNSLPLGGGYLQYFLLGWYIANHELSGKKRKWIYMLGIGMLALEIALTLGLSYQTPRLPYYDYSPGYIKNFYDIANFPELCVVVALFTWLKQSEEKIRSWNFKDQLPKAAGITFGIYLLHPFVIFYLLPFLQSWLGTSPVGVRCLAYPIVIYLVSALLTIILRKIPSAKYVLP